MLSYILYPFSFFLSIFFWQYAAKRNDWFFKPTYFIDLVTEQLVRAYTYLGKIVVWISSFYTFFDFKDLIETFEELCISVKNFLFSWQSFITSYVSNMSFYDHPYLISLGSITLISLALYLVYIFRHWWLFQSISNFAREKTNLVMEYFNSESMTSNLDSSNDGKPKRKTRQVRDS